MIARPPLLVSDDATTDERWCSARLWESWAQWVCWRDNVILDLVPGRPWQLGPLAAAIATRSTTLSASWQQVLRDPAARSDVDDATQVELQQGERTLRFAGVWSMAHALDRAVSLLPATPSFLRHGLMIDAWALCAPRARRLVEAASAHLSVGVRVLVDADGAPLEHELPVLRALEASTTSIDVHFVPPATKRVCAWHVPTSVSAAQLGHAVKDVVSPGESVVHHEAVEAHLPSSQPACLAQTPAGRLLLEVVLLRRDHAPRERLLSVWLNPARTHPVDALGAARALRCMQAAGVRSDREDLTVPTGGYADRLSRLPPSHQPDVQAIMPTVQDILVMVHRLPAAASWFQWWASLSEVASLFVSGWGLGTDALQRCVANQRQAANHLESIAPDPGMVGVHQVFTVLTELLTGFDIHQNEQSLPPSQTCAIYDDQATPQAEAQASNHRQFHVSTDVTLWWHGASPPAEPWLAWCNHEDAPQWQLYVAPKRTSLRDVAAQEVEQERLRFFRNQRTQPPSPGAHSFAVDGRRIERSFGRVFGLADRSRALTPTRVEALAQCRFRGFLETVARIRIEREPSPTLDARVLGTIAHEALEHHYAHRRSKRVPVQRHNDDDDRDLRSALATAASKLLLQATGHRPMMQAALSLLEQQLVRVVKRQAARPPVLAVEPVELEMVVGVELRGQGGMVAPALDAVPIRMPDGRTLRIGGVIDRVDEGDGGRVVLDYKTMSGASVRYKGAPQQQLVHHFQLPMYLRLLEHHRPTGVDVALHGYLLSLRDGTTSEDVGGREDLRSLVTDDDREDGLAHALGRVVLPVLNGDLSAMPGDGCEHCGLRRVCRLPLPTQLLAVLQESAAPAPGST
jgi:hypothetical protein